MANAAEDAAGYGGGAGGKFRKKPLRRPQTTPYDRPVAALRNTSSNGNNGVSSGWISKIVHPASKLISSSAHKLFSSVFRKRLLPPPRRPSPEYMPESPENQVGDVITGDCSRIQESDKNEGRAQNNGPVTDGVAELERIFNQKTFTRSEIDRLSVLLQSRAVDNSGIARQGSIELTTSEPPVGHSRQEELDGVVCGNKSYPSEVLGMDFTPTVRSKVNDVDGIASPAEIAKAYMGSRSTAVSPSILGPRVQAVREEIHALTRFQSHSPGLHTAQKPLDTPATSQNELVIPRSWGRSTLYSMSRNPYSRVLPTETKDLGTSNGASTGQSLSTSQKVLKRRSSALENDIGAVGPIRRIRQKSNLLYSKSLGQSSRTPLTHTTSEVGEASLYSSSKSQEDRGDRTKPVSSLHISSKSIEMGQRILQQLEKMTPPKERYSEKKSGISGSIILDGQAHKSLETVDSTKANIPVFPDLKPSSNLDLKKNTAIESCPPPVQPIRTSPSTKADVPTSSISFGLWSSDKVCPATSFSSSVVESHSQLSNSVSGFASGATDAGNKPPGSNSNSFKAVDLLRKPDAVGKLPVFGNSTSSSLPAAASSATPSFKNADFKFGASTISSTDNRLQASSHNVSSSQPIFVVQPCPLESASASTQESIPSQSSTPISSVSFGSSSPAVSSSVDQSGFSISAPGSFASSCIFTSSCSGFCSTPASESTNNASTNGSSPVFGSAINNSSSGLSLGASSVCTSSITASSGFALGTTSISTPANGSITGIPASASSISALANGSTSSIFAFGGSTSAFSSAPSSAVSFGAASSTPSIFSFSSTASAPAPTTPYASQPALSNGKSVFAFRSITSPSSVIKNNQMKVDDTMPDDSMQSPVLTSPSSGFGITPPGANPFQFSSQQNQSPAPSGANPFQFSSQQNQSPASSGANPFQFSSQQNQSLAQSEAIPFQFSSQQNRSPASSGANPFQFSSQQNQAQFQSGANPFQSSSQQNLAQAPSGANPFQFSSQQNEAAAPQNPFQTSGSSGGSFSLGTGGNDKSNRRIIKVKNRLRKK